MKTLCKIFILFLFLIPFNTQTFAQNNAELGNSLLWIKSKIEAYPACYTPCYEAKVIYDIPNKLLIVRYMSNWGNTVIYTIPINKINPYGFTYTKDYIFTVKTMDDDIKWEEISKKTGMSSERYESEAYLVFQNEAFQSENLQPRLIKAFRRIIELCGGIQSKEPY
jgi:hypothetical protein